MISLVCPCSLYNCELLQAACSTVVTCGCACCNVEMIILQLPVVSQFTAAVWELLPQTTGLSDINNMNILIHRTPGEKM